MLSSQAALEIILNQASPFGEECIPYLQSIGRVLKEPILADRDFPPFDRVMMDGIAISYTSIANGLTEFYIEGIQAAGAGQINLQHPNHAIEVMTGSILPEGTDTVIQYELVEILDGVARLKSTEIKSYQHIHLQGTDRKKNDELIPINTLISAVEIGLFATVGKTEVIVAKIPKTMVISTGDELIEVNKTPAQHQIRRSNVYTLLSLLEQVNIKANHSHLPDDKALLKEKLNTFLMSYDCILLSGGVSKGKYDFIAEVFAELGVQKHFHRVKQRPGKPFWFGSKDHCRVFAFPGNPVSTFVGALFYFKAWYEKGLGITNKKIHAILSEEVSFKPELTYFLQVKVAVDSGIITATPVVGNGSGDLANLALADAFLILPADQSTFNKGSIYPILLYR